MSDQRPDFHAALKSLEETTLSMADKVEGMVAMAIRSLVNSDKTLVSQVIADDDVVDEIYMEIRSRWMNIMARQQPMGRDLRMMAAILEMNNTLERMGDQSVNIARIAGLTAGLPREETILAKLQEMGDLLKPMIRTAIDAFGRRDADECLLLPAMDVPVDVLNRSMWKHVVACGNDPQLLEWATRMILVSRALERVGDQAVDIGEQVAFLLTGDHQEFLRFHDYDAD
ncbi:MAG: phosphate signaling complex protein PhoU [bacterium]|nr:phosphate signaling complex protein PhoU [Acidimicrobiia bacterium]MCY4649275.1 phosphate signaling complex protein PhoU [bacterium]